jgi:heparan-alpha-glucosaminide N-acetyltransferase
MSAKVEVTSSSTGAPVTRQRLVSLDVLRGVIILVMLFVNDIACVPGTPAWLMHADTHHDGMTFVDLVFPAFLFMVGMALPYAIGRRLAAGEPRAPLWRHILVRTIGLLAIGVLMVNADEMRPGGPLSLAGWQLLMYGGVILFWNAYDRWKESHPRRVVLLRALGVGVLLAAVLTYSGAAGTGAAALRPHWWGILGLIGWSYLVACLVYVPAQRSQEALLGGAALLLALHLGNNVGLFAAVPWTGGKIELVNAFAPHGAIVLLGAMLATMLQPHSPQVTVGARVRWTVTFAAALYLASVFLHALAPLHEMFIVSKNLGTVPWCLRASAYTALLWLAIYLLVDVGGLRRATGFLAEAGSNALFAYVLAPVVVALIDVGAPLFGRESFYDLLTPTFATGLLRAIVAAFALTWLAGALKHRGINLKL